MPRIQHFHDGDRVIPFYDKQDTILSKWSQPRDIVLVDQEDDPNLRGRIAVDIRIGQGHPEIGAAKNLLY